MSESKGDRRWMKVKGVAEAEVALQLGAEVDTLLLAQQVHQLNRRVLAHSVGGDAAGWWLF